jgi:aarF domain-containing kinase
MVEFNYAKEAENMNLIRETTMKKWGHLVEIPYAHMDLCTKHIMVMDYLRGPVLVDGIREQYRKFAKLNNTTLEALEAQRKYEIESGTFKFKSLEESEIESKNIRYWVNLYDNYLSLNPVKYIGNVTGVYKLLNNNLPYTYHKTEIPIDIAHILRVLCQVHGHQLFHGGAFNGDPHPGNILLLEDGRLGLIDYGQVKKMTSEQREIFARLILAHARKDVDEVTNIHFNELKIKTKYSKKDIAYIHSSFWYDRATPDIMQGKNIHYFMEWIEAADPIVSLPNDYLMAGRMSILLRGMGKAFGIDFAMSDLWKEEAEKYLEEYSKNKKV